MTKEVVVDFGHWGECKVEVDDINEGVRVWWSRRDNDALFGECIS